MGSKLPGVEVLLYEEADGTVPFRDWMDGLAPRARSKCVARLKRLEALGHELRRPEADYLRGGIYELRAKYGRVNLRMLYFFHGRQVVLSHGLAKERDVPPREIDLAILRKVRFAAAPRTHTFRSER